MRYCGDVTVTTVPHNNETVEVAVVFRSRCRDTLLAHLDAARAMAKANGRRTKELKVTRHVSPYSALDWWFTCKLLVGHAA